MKSIAAILWDNDGVLVETEHLYFQATREALAEMGVSFSEAEYIEYLLKDSRGAWHLAEDAGIAPEHIAAMKQWRNKRYGELIAQAPRVIDGVPETVAALAPHYAMGIVTSSRREHFDIAHAQSGLLEHFAFVIASGDYPRSKPAPDPYLLGLERIATEPRACVVVEDSERGLQAATAAGLPCIVIPSGLTRGGDFTGAAAVLESVRELPGFLNTVFR
jgi:HAD superfamily hydrolase (TIGR01509 family)